MRLRSITLVVCLLTGISAMPAVQAQEMSGEIEDAYVTGIADMLNEIEHSGGDALMAGCSGELPTCGNGTSTCSCNASGAGADCQCTGSGCQTVCTCTDAQGTVKCAWVNGPGGYDCKCKTVKKKAGAAEPAEPVAP